MSGESESLRCENCGQAVLASDFECWHCGATLSHLKTVSPALDGDQEDEESPPGGPLQQILFYALMTTIIALALVFVIHSLGQQPRLVAGIEADEESKIELIAPDGSFRLNLPVGSTWYFPREKRGQGEDAAQMAHDPTFTSALQPLFNLGSDGDLLLTAMIDSAVLAVARSERLSQLTADNVVGSLGSEEFPQSSVLSTEKGVSSTRMATAVITVEQEDPPLICRQHFLPNAGGAYLAAICSEPEQFERHAAEFDTILSSLNVR
jgi:hypothetical protein